MLGHFQGLQGTAIIVNDLVVFGTNQEEHAKRVRALLERCQTTGVKLNPAKFEMGLHAITFMGYRITSKDAEVDPEKVSGIRNMDSSEYIGDSWDG